MSGRHYNSMDNDTPRSWTRSLHQRPHRPPPLVIPSSNYQTHTLPSDLRRPRSFRRSVTVPAQDEDYYAAQSNGYVGRWRSNSGDSGRSTSRMSDLGSDGMEIGPSSASPTSNGDLHLDTGGGVCPPFSKKAPAILQRLNITGNNITDNGKMTSTGTANTHAQVMSSRMASSKRSQVLQSQHSSMSSSEIKASSSTATSSSISSSQEMKSNLSELKSSISEMKSAAHQFTSQQQSSTSSEARNFSRGVSVTSPIVTSPGGSSLNLLPHGGLIRGSVENLDLEEPDGVGTELAQLASPNLVNTVTAGGGSKELKFEQKRMSQASKTKILTDSYSAEKTTANSSQVKRVQTGDLSFQEVSSAAAMRARLEVDGISAEKSSSHMQEQRTLKAGDLMHQESRSAAASGMKLQTDTFSAEKMAVASQQQRQIVSSSGIFNQEKHMAASSQSKLTITAKGVCTKAHSSSSSMVSSSSSQSSQMLNDSRSLALCGNTALVAIEEIFSMPSFDDLEMLNADSNTEEVEQATLKYSRVMANCVDRLKQLSEIEAPTFLQKMNDMMCKAWAVPTHGHGLGYSMCNVLRNNGGMDVLIRHCQSKHEELYFGSARLLGQCMTTENRSYVVENGLERIVNVACMCASKGTACVEESRVGTGILEHLFKHSESTCSDVIRMGGLDAVLFECRKNDVETLRHCAGALANLSLYGGAENQEAMIKRKVPMWLFPLAFNNDDNIKYYACLAIAVLVANKEIEAAVLKSGTLDLVEPFVTTHSPSGFASSNMAHAHGQSKNWLQRLVPVLSSKREEARNLAAFHFCMEAGIKQKQGNANIFREIGAIEPLNKVASSPNAIASKYAAQALRLIGEEVPHKLSQQVPLWSIEDVREWVKQIGFSQYSNDFVESRVDGDLLLQLTEQMLVDDIKITNGILRKRFMRELRNLKRMADYSSCDTSNMNAFLLNISPEYAIYTYSLLNAGVDKEILRCVNGEQLLSECGVASTVHRLKITEALRVVDSGLSTASDENLDKSLDVFISYRRSNGSQLASLLKVHLQVRSVSVFIDVERLEAGKFDNNLLQSIRQAKHFLLVLTPGALDRCIGDTECKDWVHREIVGALESNCNIIPIIDNFQWPELEDLPEDMRAVGYFNGVRWIHDYQDACVEKLQRFMRGEINSRSELPPGRMGMGLGGKGDATPSTPSTIGRCPVYQRTQSMESGKGSSCSDKENGQKD